MPYWCCTQLYLCDADVHLLQSKLDMVEMGNCLCYHLRFDQSDVCHHVSSEFKGSK
jgi:hypothetical protein